VQNQIKSGFNGGSWNGNGITSSVAAAPSAHRTGLGYAEASELNVASFAGQSVDASSVLVRYTLMGDANLSGNVDLTDFTFLAAHFNQPNQTWLHGDFDYNGSVDLTDFTFLAANFNQVLSSGGAAGLGAVVPDPSGVSLVMLLVGLRRRRRGRHR